MTVNKRIWSLILSLVMILSIFNFQTYAATPPFLTAESKSVNAGEQFDVVLSLDNAISVYGGNFTLQYDSDLLTVESYEFGSMVDGYTKNCNLDYQSAGNLIRVTFSGASALTSNGALITFTFTAKEDVSGTAALQFTAYKMYDENGSSMTTSVSDGSVVIQEAVTPTMPPTPTPNPDISPAISVIGNTVSAGEEVTVWVNISNVTSVYGGNFTLQYDSDLLEVESYSFGSIVDGHTKNCNLDYQSAGNLIRVTFSGASVLTSNGALITFTFTAKEDVSGTAALQFTAYKMYDENGSSMTTSASDGSVVIQSVVTPIVTPTPTPTLNPDINPAISVIGNTVSAGEEVTVSVNISNVTSVYGGNFTLQYDSDLLAVESYAFGSIVDGHTKNCNLDYHSAGNLIRVTFSGASAITSDGTLVTFTFKAKENVSGTAALQFTTYKMYDENGGSMATSASDGSVVVDAIVNPILYGDADMSGTVDAIDAMVVLQYDVELIDKNEIDLIAADVDGNGVVDAIDAMLILQYDVELITIFPVEEMYI